MEKSSKHSLKVNIKHDWFFYNCSNEGYQIQASDYENTCSNLLRNIWLVHLNMYYDCNYDVSNLFIATLIRLYRTVFSRST